jgi:hypothetical protein
MEVVCLQPLLFDLLFNLLCHTRDSSIGRGQSDGLYIADFERGAEPSAGREEYHAQAARAKRRSPGDV